MKYCFFPGCSYQSSAGYKESTLAVTRKLGMELKEIPDWNCCGATVYMGVDILKAAVLTGRLIALAQKEGFDEIVTGCNACYTTVAKMAGVLLDDESLLEQVNHKLSAEGLVAEGPFKIRHLLDVFVNDIPAEAWFSGAREKWQEVSVAAYYGCQLTRPKSDFDHPERPTSLDSLIENLGFHAVDHSAKTICCGASLAVPYEKECSPLISRILKGSQMKGADLITTVCPLCQFNLDGGQNHIKDVPRMPVLFFTQLAGLSLGLSPEDLGLQKLIVPIDGVLKKRL